MSDLFDSMFATLRGQSPPVPFAPAEAVRRRGRQRAHRQAVSAGVAVIAVIGLGAGAVATVSGGPDPDPGPPPAATTPGPGPTSPAPTPVHTEIPEQWLLAAGDLGPGEWVIADFELERFEGDPPWSWGDLCEGVQAPSLDSRVDLATVAWTDGPWEGEGDPGPTPGWVDQVVELFAPGVAVANLEDIRAAVDRCARPVQLTPGVEAPMYEVVDSGFAGDESLLVLEVAEGDVYIYTAVARVGDAVTTLRTYDPELARSDAQYLRSVVIRAATRLR